MPHTTPRPVCAGDAKGAAARRAAAIWAGVSSVFALAPPAPPITNSGGSGASSSSDTMMTSSLNRGGTRLPQLPDAPLCPRMPPAEDSPRPTQAPDTLRLPPLLPPPDSPTAARARSKKRSAKTSAEYHPRPLISSLSTSAAAVVAGMPIPIRFRTNAASVRLETSGGPPAIAAMGEGGDGREERKKRPTVAPSTPLVGRRCAMAADANGPEDQEMGPGATLMTDTVTATRERGGRVSAIATRLIKKGTKTVPTSRLKRTSRRLTDIPICQLCAAQSW